LSIYPYKKDIARSKYYWIKPILNVTLPLKDFIGCSDGIFYNQLRKSISLEEYAMFFLCQKTDDHNNFVINYYTKRE
jgi:hypothetical protein